MAANTDKLRKVKSRFSTTLNGSITDSDDTIALSSASGLATDTAVTLSIDRVDANGDSTPSLHEVVTGVISSNNLTNALRAQDGSTAQAHSSGAVVEMIWNADIYNDAVDWGLVEHAQDGTHAAITPNSVDINGTVVLTGTLDEDTMVSDSAVKLATQQSIKAYVDKKGAISILVVAPTVNTSTGDGKFYFTIPTKLNGAIITAVHAQVITAGTTGTTDIQIHNVTDAVDILSTKLTIDSTETSSATAATPAVINASNDDMATNDLIRIDVDAVHTTPAKGLIVRIEFGAA